MKNSSNRKRNNCGQLQIYTHTHTPQDSHFIQLYTEGNCSTVLQSLEYKLQISCSEITLGHTEQQSNSIVHSTVYLSMSDYTNKYFTLNTFILQN